MFAHRLSHDDQALVRAALRQAESRSHAHFVLSVVPLSDRYLTYPLAWAGVLALVVEGVLAGFMPALSLRLGFLAAAAAFAVFAFVLDWLPLRLLIAPQGIRHQRAEALAHREFAVHILATGKSGILLFVSLGERYVELIADESVHRRVGEAAWQEIVGTFSASAGRGRIADGLIAAIGRCADLLEAHFPNPDSPKG
jgi:putative membrane protein